MKTRVGERNGVIWLCYHIGKKHYEAFWNPGIPEKLIWREQNKKTGTRDSKAQRDSTEGKTFDICFA